jgi:CheY-like chemotaxis protein
MASLLVVDDSRVERGLVGGLLEKQEGMQVAYAGNGLEAVRVMEDQTIDLVVTDLRMPEMNGLELVDEIRRRRTDIPVVLVTAFGSERLAAEALLHGAVSYVPKSQLNHQLIPTVLEILEIARADRSYSPLLDCLTLNQYRFELPNCVEVIESAVDLMQNVALGMRLFDRTARIQMGVALEHALLNSMYHGNLEIDAEQTNLIRSSRSQGREYEWVRSLARKHPYANRRIFFDAEISAEQARFQIRDEGPGFDTSSLPDPQEPANLQREKGRGLVLIQTLMDEVAFNDRGNEVTLIKHGLKTTP